MTAESISVVQMNSCDEVNANLQSAKQLIMQAADTGAKLVVLPEVFAFIGNDVRQQCEIGEADGDGPIQDFLSAQAVERGVWLLGGTVPILAPDSDKVYATAMLYDAQGNRVASYRKIHLFDVYVSESGNRYAESAAFEPGREIAVVDTPVGRLGIAVCYDLRFPEMFRLMAEAGAELVAVPAAFTQVTGRAHWHILLKARAIENQVYVAAAAQVGQHSDMRKTYGHSMIVDSWGDTLAENPDTVAPISAVIDLERQKHLRKEFPCLSHRVFNSAGKSS